MIHTCFSPIYCADTPTASMRKLPIIAEIVEKEKFAQLHDPGSIDPAILRKLHDPRYVDQFLSGEGELASSQGWPWTEKIRDGVLAINAGQLLGAKLALEHGVAANIAQGFHHSCYARGMGFCTFNGLALIAQENPTLKVGVLDCDEHLGNGTTEFTRRLPNLYNYSIYGSTFRERENERAVHRHIFDVTNDFQKYLNVLLDGLDKLSEWNVDLIIYQAGADPHIDDPYGFTGLTTQQMAIRDRLVFNSIKYNLKKPVLFVMAGGYQEPIREKLAPLHVQTFRIADDVFNSEMMKLTEKIHVIRSTTTKNRPY